MRTPTTDGHEDQHANETFLMKGQSDRDGSDVESLRTDDDGGDADRHHWGRKLEYILCMVGFCVGLGNIWRFPYVCMRNGGGAFLIPFFLSLLLCALPIYFLESAMGQFNARSCYHVWKICPLFKGIGVSMNILSVFFVWYYSIILAWTVIYMYHSFSTTLPWTRCDHEWNSPLCVTPQGLFHNSSNTSANNGNNDNLFTTLALAGNGTSNSSNAILPEYASRQTSDFLNRTNNTIPSTEEFWIHKVLERSSGIDELGGLPCHTTLALIFANVCILLSVIKGIRSTGKVVYVTATLPYILLTVMLILGISLPGSGEGIRFYIEPDFSKLLTSQTWIDAFVQVFYSLGPGWGGLITMSSYNKFNNNCMRDSILLTLCCEATSVYGGFAIFAILGHMAYVTEIPISAFAKSGAGLAFIVYPTAISYLPIPQLWGFIFFLMLFTLGLDSQFAGVETYMTSILEFGFRWMAVWRKTVTALVMGVVTLTSLVFASRGGIYVFSLIDWYIAAFSILFQAALECMVIAWIYGSDRFCRDIELMLGRKPYKAFVVCWRFVSPVLLLSVLVTTLAKFVPASYEDQTFPHYAQVFGWLIALLPSSFIIMFSLVELLSHQGSIWMRVQTACRPHPEWRPSLPEMREKYSHDLDDTQTQTDIKDVKTLFFGRI